MIKKSVTEGRFCIPYRIYGNGGPHIVCLNGVQQSMAMWHSFIQRFSGEYRVVVFDFPGQGKGKVLSGSDHISIDEQVDILKAVVKASGVKDVTICSASWGGVVALAFSAKFPKAIKRMLLGGLGTRPNKIMVETIKKGLCVDSDNRQEMAKVLIKGFGKDLPEKMKNSIYKQFCNMSKERLRAFCDHGLFILSEKNLGEVVDFKNIHTETILIRAENDTITDLDDVKFLAAQLPNCRLITVKDVGHFLHVENDDVLEVYHKFLPASKHLSKSKDTFKG